VSYPRAPEPGTSQIEGLLLHQHGSVIASNDTFNSFRLAVEGSPDIESMNSLVHMLGLKFLIAPSAAELIRTLPYSACCYITSPVTGLEWPRGFQEVEVPRFHDNGTGWW